MLLNWEEAFCAFICLVYFWYRYRTIFHNLCSCSRPRCYCFSKLQTFRYLNKTTAESNERLNWRRKIYNTGWVVWSWSRWKATIDSQVSGSFLVMVEQRQYTNLHHGIIAIVKSKPTTSSGETNHCESSGSSSFTSFKTCCQSHLLPVCYSVLHPSLLLSQGFCL